MNSCDRLTSYFTLIKQLKQFVSIGLLLFIGVNPSSVKGQIIPDDTLGEENTQVRDNLNQRDISADSNTSDLIEGGAQRQNNLFHSFSEFNVEAGQEAYFANPPGVANIFGRVTGSNVSEIMGKLGVQGNADLFLINPNGIIFGANSTLDLRGSFTASSASSVVFDNGFQFDAVNPETPPLLTISQPVGLNIGGEPGAIINSSSSNDVGLQVSPGQEISLIGGDVRLDGGLITALGGKVTLSGLATPGLIAINGDHNLQSAPSSTPANIFLTEATVDVRTANDSSNDGGSIAIDGNNISLLETSNLLGGIGSMTGTAEAQAGNLTLNATETITLGQASRLENQVNLTAVGNSGNIELNANFLDVSEGSVISTDVSGKGTGGEILIQAVAGLRLSNSNIFNDVNPLAQGNTQGIEIKAGTTTIKNNSIVSSSVLGAGEGNSASGGINIQGESLFVTENSTLSSSLTAGGRGKAGDISISTNSEVVFDNGFVRSRLEKGAIGGGGNIEIATGSLLVTGVSAEAAAARTGQITTATFGQGDAGDVIINAQDNVVLDGRGSDIFTLVAFDQGRGNAGNIEINSSSLTIDNQARLVASSEAFGDPGDITINTNSFVIDQRGQISNDTLANRNITLPRSGGEIVINTNSFFAGEGSRLNLGTLGNDRPGNLTIKVLGSAILDRAVILAEAPTVIEGGDGGNISLEIADTLQLRNESNISTTAGIQGVGGNGGNIDIDAEFIVAAPAENSNITANAFQGRGGAIRISALDVFGIEARESLTSLSDITAFSQQNPQIESDIMITVSDLDSKPELSKLPEAFVDLSSLTIAACPQDNVATAARSKFILTGRGGLPPEPEDNLRILPISTGEKTQENSGQDFEPPQTENLQLSPSPTPGIETVKETIPEVVVEATQLTHNSQGKLLLVAAPAATSLPNYHLNSAECNS